MVAILAFVSGKRKPEFLNERALLEDLMGRADQSGAPKRKKPREGLYWDVRYLVAGAGFEPAAFRL